MRNNLFKILALEESNNTVVKKETEYVIYAKIGNAEGLKSAISTEHHLQIEAMLKSGAKTRVRATTKDNITSYEYTLKLKHKENEEGNEFNNEYNIQVDQTFLLAYQKAADKYVDKNRYKFKSEQVRMKAIIDDKPMEIDIPNIEYEVDVYKRKDGTFSQWCKIDIEVDNILNFIKANYPYIKDIRLNVKISHLPFEPTEAILVANATEEQHKFLSNLWDTEFNIFLNKETDEPE